MKGNTEKNKITRKIALIGILTALTAVLALIKIPIAGTTTITLVLPVVVIGAALLGPFVGAWLTVIPNIIAFGEAGIFLVESPAGCTATLLLKGLLAGFVAGALYKVLHEKHPKSAVVSASVATPVINSGVFLLGCYLFIWDKLVALAGENGIGIGMLVVGMVVINFAIELVLNLVLCPTILRIIQIAAKKYSK